MTLILHITAPPPYITVCPFTSVSSVPPLFHSAPFYIAAPALHQSIPFCITAPLHYSAPLHPSPRLHHSASFTLMSSLYITAPPLSITDLLPLQQCPQLPPHIAVPFLFTSVSSVTPLHHSPFLASKSPLTWSPAPFLAPTDSRPLYSHPYLHLSLLHHPSPLTALLPTTLLQPYQFYLTQRVGGGGRGVPGQRAGAALFMLTGDELLGSAHKKKITSLRTWEVRQLPPSVWTCHAFCHLLAVRMNAVAAVGEMRIWPGLCLDWGPPFSDAWSKY